MKLLTINQAKAKKSAGKGILTAILHLAPANLSGYNTCKYASAGCRAACLNISGMGAFPKVQEARIRKTKYFFEQQEAFMLELFDDIKEHIANAKKQNMTPAIRLNGTSDIKWEDIYITFEGKKTNVFEYFTEVMFYDYTKDFTRIKKGGYVYPNYHLTFSLSEVNEKFAKQAHEAKMNVAVVLPVRKSSDPLPEKLKMFGSEIVVVDGDIDDVRYQDGTSLIVGLRMKCRANTDKTGFVKRDIK